MSTFYSDDKIVDNVLSYGIRDGFLHVMYDIPGSANLGPFQLSMKADLVMAVEMSFVSSAEDK
jgi:hypothetical protein